MLCAAYPGAAGIGPAMVAFATQVRRFTDQLHAAEPAFPAFGLTAQAMRLQIASLLMDCPQRSQEQACKAASRLLD